MATPLTAGEVCTRVVTVVDPGSTVADSARLMREHHVGCVVVVRGGEPRVPVGLLTDRDIVTAVVAKDMDVRLLRVEDVMSTELALARESESVLDLMRLMRRKGVRRLPVVGAGGELLGLVTLDDLLEIVTEEMQALVAAIGSGQSRERALRA